MKRIDKGLTLLPCVMMRGKRGLMEIKMTIINEKADRLAVRQALMDDIAPIRKLDWLLEQRS